MKIGEETAAEHLSCEIVTSDTAIIYEYPRTYLLYRIIITNTSDFALRISQNHTTIRRNASIPDIDCVSTSTTVIFLEAHCLQNANGTDRLCSAARGFLALPNVTFRKI